MRFREFIRENRKEIDAYIIKKVPNLHYPINDKERREWVLNDEPLYRWAQREGVKI